MRIRIPIVLCFLLAAGPALLAQDKKIELIPFVAYTLSEGIDFDAADIGTGQIVNNLTPKSGFTYGFQVDLLANENFAVGFLFSDQLSKLEIGLQNGDKEDLTDMNVRNYHGIFTYNVGEGGRIRCGLIYSAVWAPPSILRTVSTETVLTAPPDFRPPGAQG